jgi:hypothetical protein
MSRRFTPQVSLKVDDCHVLIDVQRDTTRLDKPGRSSPFRPCPWPAPEHNRRQRTSSTHKMTRLHNIPFFFKGQGTYNFGGSCTHGSLRGSDLESVE